MNLELNYARRKSDIENERLPPVEKRQFTCASTSPGPSLSTAAPAQRENAAGGATPVTPFKRPKEGKVSADDSSLFSHLHGVCGDGLWGLPTLSGVVWAAGVVTCGSPLSTGGFLVWCVPRGEHRSHL